MRVYADNAATTALGRAAREAMLPYLWDQYGNPSSAHAPGRAARAALERAREDVAAAVGAESPAEIVFTSGGSEADNQAILSAARAGARRGKKHLVSTAFEHHAVLHTLDKLAREGFAVTLVRPGRDGLVRPGDVAAALRDDTALASVMYANNEIGTVQPIAEIGAICRERGVPFHTDAVQAAGHVPIDAAGQNIDLLSLSGHKFHGPKGTGVLYARRGIGIERLIEGGGQERGRRPGTENVMGAAGLAAALKDAVAHLGREAAYVGALRDRITEGLLEIPDAVLHGDRTARLPGNVSVGFAGVDGTSLLLMLDERGVAVSAGSACAASSPEPSHVLLAIGVPPDLARGSLRISLSAFNTPAEAEYIIRAVKEAVETLRGTAPAWERRETVTAAPAGSRTGPLSRGPLSC